MTIYTYTAEDGSKHRYCLTGINDIVWQRREDKPMRIFTIGDLDVFFYKNHQGAPCAILSTIGSYDESRLTVAEAKRLADRLLKFVAKERANSDVNHPRSRANTQKASKP